MIYINNIRHVLDDTTTTENKLNERGEAVPYELRVGVELQSRGVRIPVQCPDTAKPPVGVSERERERETGQAGRKRKPRGWNQTVSHTTDVKDGRKDRESGESKQSVC